MFWQRVKVKPSEIVVDSKTAELEINLFQRKEIEFRYMDTAQVVFKELLAKSPLYFHLSHPNNLHLTSNEYLVFGSKNSLHVRNGNNVNYIGIPISLSMGSGSVPLSVIHDSSKRSHFDSTKSNVFTNQKLTRSNQNQRTGKAKKDIGGQNKNRCSIS